MKRFFLIFISLVMNIGLAWSQDFVLFKGNAGTTTDSLYYCFDGNKSEPYAIKVDKKGNYSLSVKFKYEKTISFYYQNALLDQTLDLKKIRSHIKKTGCQFLQNDAILLRSFAFVRPKSSLVDSMKIVLGNYVSLDERHLTLDNDYKLSYVDKDIAYDEEGTWTVENNIITFKAVFLKIAETGTMKQINKTYQLRYERDKLIKSTGDVDFSKKD